MGRMTSVVSGQPVFVAGKYVSGQILTVSYSPGVFGTIQFTRTLVAAPYTKSLIPGAVATNVNTLSYQLVGADVGYVVGADYSSQISSTAGAMVIASPPYLFVMNNVVGISIERVTPYDPDATFRVIKNGSPYPINIYPSANINYQNNRPSTGAVVCPVGSESVLNDGGSYYATTRAVAITALSFSGGIATATAAAHGLVVGDTIVVLGALDSAVASPYNTLQNTYVLVLSVPDANTFTYTPGGTPTTTAPTTMPKCGPVAFPITVERSFS